MHGWIEPSSSWQPKAEANSTADSRVNSGKPPNSSISASAQIIIRFGIHPPRLVRFRGKQTIWTEPHVVMHVTAEMRTKTSLPPPFLAVYFRVLPCGMVLVLGGLQVLTECNPSVMRSLFVIARFVMLGGFAMMFGSVFVMLSCLFVILVISCSAILFSQTFRGCKKGHTAPEIQLTRQIVYELIGRRAV
jgi:hypothetical protein